VHYEDRSGFAFGGEGALTNGFSSIILLVVPTHCVCGVHHEAILCTTKIGAALHLMQREGGRRRLAVAPRPNHSRASRRRGAAAPMQKFRLPPNTACTLLPCRAPQRLRRCLTKPLNLKRLSCPLICPEPG
jgi:hypothetical protein